MVEVNRDPNGNGALPREPVQFSLRSLMLTVAIIAVALSVVRIRESRGWIDAYAAIVVVSLVILVRGHKTAGERLVFDLLWGALMPVAYVVVDGGILGLFDPPERPPGAAGSLWLGNDTFPGFGSAEVGKLAFCLWQAAIATWWILAGPVTGRRAAIVAGTMMAGCAAAGVWFPVAFVRGVSNIVMDGDPTGIMAVTPIFTVLAWARCAAEASLGTLAMHVHWRRVAIWAGIAIPLVIAYLAARLWDVWFVGMMTA